jgi:ATP-dependent DNA ligase
VCFEPKWDGYRLLVFAHADGRVVLQSRNGRDLTAAFPELAAAAAALGEDAVVDGEAVIYTGGRLSFTALQHRLGRPAHATRRLAAEQPAHLVAFDLLQRGDTELLGSPFQDRRSALQELFDDHALQAPWSLTPASTDRAQVQEWMSSWTAVGVEGVVAKGLAQTYQPGRRGWLKVRAKHTAGAVIGAVTGPLERPDTLLLGRYDTTGTLRLTARSTPLLPTVREDLARLLTPSSVGHPWAGMRITTHWGSRDSLVFTCVTPDQIAEFDADTAFDRGRYRHPVRIRRLRPDMAPDDIPPFEQAGSA